MKFTSVDITKRFINHISLAGILAVFLSLTNAQIRPVSVSAYAEWPTLRANNGRNGRVDSRGEFQERAVVSEAIDNTTSESYIELKAANTESVVEYQAGKLDDINALSSLHSEWQTDPSPYLDLYGDEKLTKVMPSQNIKFARLFNNDSKYYRIEAFDGFGTSVNENDDVFVGFRIYEANTNRLKLEKKFKKGVHMQRPHITVADMNNDSEKDIVITSWEGIYVFNNKGDSIAGLSQEAKGWHHLRKRGFACIRDIDGNGFKDVIIIGAYPYHVDVIRNEKGVLQLGWTEIFDGHIESAKKVSKPILNSVNDFDGDGTIEILVNVFNFNQDNNWAGVLFDAATGNVKAQIKGAYVISAEDLNHDGNYFFFCSKTQDQSVPAATALYVRAFKGGKINDLLHIEKGEWINPRTPNTSPTITSHADGISNLGENTVLCVDYENSGHQAFFIRTRNKSGHSLISGYSISGGSVRKAKLEVDIPEGMYGEIIRGRSTGDDHRLLLRVKASGTPGEIIKIKGAVSRDRGRYKSSGTKDYLPVVADLDGDGKAEIIIPNDLGEVVCFGRDKRDRMKPSWKVEGCGMQLQYTLNIDYGVSVDDLDHDGKKEVIVSGANEKGASLVVYDHNGRLVWRKDFPQINAGELTTFNGNIAFYGTAQSSRRKHRDVIVTVQKGIQHTGRTYCLNGLNGNVIWKLDTLTADNGSHRTVMSGAGGNVFSTDDIDGDGSDEVMCGYGNIVFFADANDGSIKFKEFMRKAFIDKYDYPAHGYTSFWVDQILPVAFSDNGKTELSCFNASIVSGTMTAKGVLQWYPEQLNYRGRYWQCMADLDGDGKLWVAELSIRISDNTPVLFAYDPVTGSPHKTFSLDIPEFTAASGWRFMPVASDLNGDGKDEIIVSNAEGIHCFGYREGKVTTLWKYAINGCGPAIIADVDSDGFVEVVTATQEGKIMILDKQ